MIPQAVTLHGACVAMRMHAVADMYVCIYTAVLWLIQHAGSQQCVWTCRVRMHVSVVRLHSDSTWAIKPLGPKFCIVVLARTELCACLVERGVFFCAVRVNLAKGVTHHAWGKL